MVNSAVFNRGSVKNIRIIHKLILLIAEKYLINTSVESGKKLSLSLKWNTKVANTMNKTVTKLDGRISQQTPLMETVNEKYAACDLSFFSDF